MGNPQTRPTLDGVAQQAGVSKATVSKVLNDRPDVALATRTRVREALDEVGYQPNTARRQASVPTVTAQFDAFVNLYSSQVLAGVVGAGLEQSVDVVVTHLPKDAGPAALTPAWFRQRADKGHLGIIAVTTRLSPSQVHACTAAGLSLVVIDPVEVELDRYNELISVSATNWSGGMQATEHLIDLGHRRIGFAGGTPGSRPAEQRLHGHLAALTSAGISRDAAPIDLIGFTYEDGRNSAAAMLDLAEPPSAIVAGCDASALGIMEAARHRGLRLPEDLSIVGFDDTYAAEWSSPQLTTVRQPMREMGRLALRQLLSSASGQRPETHHFELATSLIVRHSTAPPAIA